MKNLMMGMMLSCDKATALMEKGIDVGLSFTEKLKLKFHTGMCDGCANYRKQTELIHQLLRKHICINEHHEPIQYTVPHNLKTNILSKLDNLGHK